jgi:hypothetical protein
MSERLGYAHEHCDHVPCTTSASPVTVSQFSHVRQGAVADRKTIPVVRHWLGQGKWVAIEGAANHADRVGNGSLRRALDGRVKV